ncbi:unnamed protein product [Caenorhabditis brenneri]
MHREMQGRRLRKPKNCQKNGWKKAFHYGIGGRSHNQGRRQNLNDYRYTVQVEDYIIDATEYGNETRFINHSCAPDGYCDW